jgi:2-dehydro-3-deoxygalactonokinase
MRWAEGFIAVDWGTTNRRSYLIGADGRLGESIEDDQGILSVPPGGFPKAVADLRDRLGDGPMLLAGMVGSNRGWVEVPYVRCPAGAEDLADRVTWAEPGVAAIIPGVAYADGDAADVMRGEEVQIVGAVAAGLVPRTCLICQPGTHNKWIRVEDGRIASFRTIMTGELFNLLKQHSILSDLLAEPASIGAAFDAGVRRGWSCDDLTAELFSVRARVLLGKAERQDASSYVSGLLVGTDARIGLAFAPSDDLFVMGGPELTRLFSAALRLLGRQVHEIDGEKAFLAGIRRVAELIR